MSEFEIIKKWLNILFKPFIKNILMMTLFTIVIILCGFISPFLTKNIIDKGILSKDISSLFYYLIYFILIYLIQYLAEYFQYIYYKPLCVEIPNKLNEMVWLHVLNIRIKYFKERNFSEILAENIQDISNITSLIDANLLTSMVTLIKVVVGYIALFYISPYLIVLLIIISPIKLLVNTRFYKKKININKKLLVEQTKFSKWIGDCISGISEIRMWDIVEDKKHELNNILENFKEKRNRLLNYSFFEAFIGSVLMLIANLGIYLVGGILIFQGVLTLGGLLAFITYSSFVFEPLEIISVLLNRLSVVSPSLIRFNNFMNTDVEKDIDQAIALEKDLSINTLQFNNIRFSYDEKTILRDINLTIKKNEVIGLVGQNGSGKTSIVNILTRFYETYEGEILINNYNIRDIKLKSYRRTLAIMSQNNYIFNDTITNNINITRKLSEKEIKFYSILSGLDESISNIPEGYNYIVGFDGQQLSGGQRQKLAMARTLSKQKAKILILDEATSNYDILSSDNIINKIIESSHFDIVIVISHQLEILKKLDRLIFIKDGDILGDGSYDELMMNNEFKELVDKSNL